ncbi:MAG: GIY-YIG nuclease family protein, partial [Bacteroidia bacterium]
MLGRKMTAGYLYVLENKSFGANVVKIGLTTRTPDFRAREIYAGATGVPLPFDIAMAYSVVDCHRAEKIAHARLRVYRLNKRREFFRLPLAIAVAVAHEACKQVNAESTAPEPTSFAFAARRPPCSPTPHPLSDETDEGDGR